MGQNRQGQGVLGKATLNWGPTWTPDRDAHTCTPTPRPNTGPEAGTLRPPEPTSWGAHSRVETSLDYWRRKCSHRPRRRGSELLVGPELYSPTHSLSLSALSQPRAKPVTADFSSLSLGPAPPPPRASQAPPRPLLSPAPRISSQLGATGLWPHLIFLWRPGDAEVAAEHDGGIVPAREAGAFRHVLSAGQDMSAPVQLSASLLLYLQSPLPWQFGPRDSRAAPTHL